MSGIKTAAKLEETEARADAERGVARGLEAELAQARSREAGLQAHVNRLVDRVRDEEARVEAATDLLLRERREWEDESVRARAQAEASALAERVAAAELLEAAHATSEKLKLECEAKVAVAHLGPRARRPVELLHRGARLAFDELVDAAGKIALGGFGEGLDQGACDGEAKDTVAEKLEPLVIVPGAVAARARMGQGPCDEVLVLEAMAEGLLEI
jgi:hypothetical protein